MTDTQPHPAQRFVAPTAIQAGTPLKELMDRRLIDLIGESLAAVVHGFDRKRFASRAATGLEPLELMQRAAEIGRAMAEQLPEDFDEAGPLLIQSFGPPLAMTEGNGLAPFFYLPHSQLIATRGVAKFASGMAANYELTKRFTAEFCIRPFLIEHRSRSLTLLRRWTKDDNVHVRRLVSEGTRPRLPWAMRLPEFQADPRFTLPLLERLRDDDELYVRRSVANHLGDIAKDHLEFAFDVCEQWLAEVETSRGTSRAKNRRWLIRHAIRLPAKQGNDRAMAIRERAAGKSR